MDYENNYLKLRKLIQMDGTIYHNFTEDFKILPFQTKTENRPNFKKFGMEKIIGELVRLVNNKEQIIDLSIEEIINGVINDERIECNDSDKKYLKALFNDYFIDKNGDLVVRDPILFLYKSKSPAKKGKKGEEEIAKFFRDVFFKDFTELNNFFSFYEDVEKTKFVKSSDILVNILLKFLPSLSDHEENYAYVSKVDYVTTLFRKDIEFALKHKDFFIEDMENLFAYYYFFYMSQLCLMLFEEEVYTKPFPLYYLLDTESANSDRETINSGFSILESRNKRVVDKIYLIEYINVLLGTEGLLLAELKEYVYSMGSTEYNKFIEIFKRFLIDYANKKNYSFDGNLNTDFSGLCDIFYEFLDRKNKKDKSVAGRYSLFLEEFANKYFLKSRRTYGKLLNIDQGMLLAITSVCIKKEKIKLNELFEEYEKRGLFFDSDSRDEIVLFLTKLDLIDKKSDSGDAQYVKRIL